MKAAIVLVGMVLAITAARPQESQRIGLRLILVRTEAEASDVLARVTKGESFEEVARRVSIDPSAASGGLLGVLDANDLRSELRSALAGVSPGHVSAIVKLSTGFAVLYKLTPDETQRLLHEADELARKRKLYAPLLEAVMKGDRGAVGRLLLEKPDLNAQGSDGRTALHEATFAERVDMIELLADSGANVNISDRLGVTPLHLAAAVGNPAAIRVLLPKGAQVNARNASGCTPLNLAAEKTEEIVRMLISSGADVNVGCRHGVLNVDGITALHTAVNSGNRVIVQLLLEAKAAVNAKDSLGQQPLMLALLGEHWEIGDRLIEHGADVLFDMSVLDGGVAMVRSAADRGYPFAQFGLGAAYQFGAAGVSTNLAEARAWYMKAAKQGHPGASNGLGWMYQYGLGGELEIREAARWYRAAAEKDYLRAQNNLGFLLMNYAEVRDYPAALQGLRKAADRNHADALNNLGTAYERGLGVKQDYGAAADLYRKSAELGSLPSSAGRLAQLYMKGLGVKQDDAQAYAWLLLAIRSANIVFRNPEVDQSDFMHADLERLAGRLKRADISAAEEWVSKWLETHRPK